ncbi:MAG: MaoC domain protein dehydratase [Candidatus Acidoferrum typicum]|nr:MaoC domain protein dehydratase [Candidatus Acidoferrum typicum]
MSQNRISVLPWKPNCEISVEKSVSSSPQFADFAKIQPGSETSFSKTITAEDVESFARLSGDRNPLHMNDEFAARTHFQRRVVHGMLLASYVSALVGMHCPGPGALWAQQSFRWQAPAFIGDRIVITLKVKHKSMGSRTLTLEVKAVNQDGKTLMEGEGTVSALEEKKRSEDVPVSERVAFVSGGARGIGAAISLALGRAGAAVVVNYRNSAVAAEQLCAEIRRGGGRAISVQADVSDYSSVAETAVLACAEFKHPIDLLINNAGTVPEPRPFMETTWEEIQSALDVHLRGAVHCCQAMVPGMMAQKSGRIINIGSAFVRATPPPNWSCFLLAKSAVQALTRCLASELGPYGIRVNSVLPGLVETDAISGLSERLRKVQAMQTPLRRLATPSEIAAAVTALCTGPGDFINGAEIPVSGGFQM